MYLQKGLICTKTTNASLKIIIPTFNDSFFDYMGIPLDENSFEVLSPDNNSSISVGVEDLNSTSLSSTSSISTASPSASPIGSSTPSKKRASPSKQSTGQAGAQKKLFKGNKKTIKDLKFSI